MRSTCSPPAAPTAATTSPSPSRSAPIRTSTPSTCRTARSLATPQLPQEVQRAGLTIRKKSAALLQVISLYSPKNTYDAVSVSNYATINIIDALARIRGVGQATLFGPLDYSLRIWLDPDRLTELNLTPNDVIAAVQSQNVQAALGRIGAAPITARPAAPDQHQDQGAADASPRNSPTSSCAPTPTARCVRVKDVARVELGAKSQERYSRFNGAPAAAIGIYQTPGANAVEVARQVRETMERAGRRASPRTSPIRVVLRHHRLRHGDDR